MPFYKFFLYKIISSAIRITKPYLLTAVCLGISEFGEEKSVLLDGLTEQQIDGKLKELVLPS
jgi:hypothetical protein